MKPKRKLTLAAIFVCISILAVSIISGLPKSTSSSLSATQMSTATPALASRLSLDDYSDLGYAIVDSYPTDSISHLPDQSYQDGMTVGIPTATPQYPNETVEIPIGVNFSTYDDKWEYMERLHGISYHPEGDPFVTFQVKFNGETYESGKIWMTPGQYRALHSRLKQGFPVFYGYTALVKIDGNFLEVHDIYDPEMKLIWNTGMSAETLPPRELSELEISGLVYARQQGWDSFTEYPPYNPEDYMSPDEKWSPLEVLARSVAFVDYVTDADNRVFIQTWYGVDVNYRWVDRDTKQVLKLVDSDAQLIQYPPSGWVEMQISPWDQEDWQSDMFKRLVPGYVLGVDQTGDIINSGQVGWALSEMEQAHRTDEWTQEKILNILNKYENIAINK